MYFGFGRVTAVTVRRREDPAPEDQASLCRDQWEAALPGLVFAPDA
jgi:hypothetical protein